MSLYLCLTRPEILKKREKREFTVLNRPNGIWEDFEVSRLQECLKTTIGAFEIEAVTEVYEDCEKGDFSKIILLGHFTQEQVFKAIWKRREPFIVTHVVGIENLPFAPPWALEEGKYLELQAVTKEQDQIMKEIDYIFATAQNRTEAEKYITENICPKFNEVDKRHSKVLREWLKAMEDNVRREEM